MKSTIKAKLVILAMVLSVWAASCSIPDWGGGGKGCEGCLPTFGQVAIVHSV